MPKPSLKRFLWWFSVYLIRAGGLPALLMPVRLPPNEAAKVEAACGVVDTVLVFNPGGWGDASLEEADDFRPILHGMQAVIKECGYSSVVVPYLRTMDGLAGRLTGMKDQILSFRYSSRKQEKEIRDLALAHPQRRFILVGFSTGGGLTGRTLPRLEDLGNVLGVTVGVPGWFTTFCSEKSLVLNNSGKDPLVAGDIYRVSLHVFRAPYVWLKAKSRGQKLSLPLAFHFPNHEYAWDSLEVGPPLIRFLRSHLP
jgi:hypothetical protein